MSNVFCVEINAKVCDKWTLFARYRESFRTMKYIYKKCFLALSALLAMFIGLGDAWADVFDPNATEYTREKNIGSDINLDRLPGSQPQIAQDISNPGLPGVQPPVGQQSLEPPSEPSAKPKTILINFNNVAVTEFIRFISKISNKNFVFNEADLQFNVTIVSEEPTTIDNIMTALLQELRINGLTMIEEGNNIVIHKNPLVNAISTVVSGSEPEPIPRNAQIITRLFRLNTVDPDKAATILRPLVSASAIVEVFRETNYVIVTDLASNIAQIEKLLKSIDAPNSGLSIGQYVVKNGYIDSLINIADSIMKPIAQEQPLIFVPHRAANSIFIVANPFMIERTLSILQYLDQNQGLTRIFDLKDLKFSPEAARSGGWQLDESGKWVYRPFQEPGVPSVAHPPSGYWYIDDQGNWRFQAGGIPPGPEGMAGVGVGPEGQWRLDSNGIWVFQLAPGKSISPERIARPAQGLAELPVGHIERTQFYMYKLNYRKGDQVQIALGRIAMSLRAAGSTNPDLITTLESVQLVEATNALIFTGTVESLTKVSELITEIDIPVRQVFIEMLILNTTIQDSLLFSVDWGTRFGGGNWAGSQAWLSNGSTLPSGLDTTGLSIPAPGGQGLPLTPNANNLARNPGFSQGIVGQTLTMGNLHFNSIGALVQALHGRIEEDILICPKLLVEDNTPAQIFVGINTPYPVQAIANNFGTIVTQNFEYRNVGTQVNVTPLIGDNGMITLTILEQVSSVVTATTVPGTVGGPTTSLNTTTTRVHIPNGYFLILSGMMEDDDLLNRQEIPCLGGLPIIGGAFSNRNRNCSKRNLMIFLRPVIIETEEEIDNITKHQQDIWIYKNRMKPSWKYEVDEALEFLNLPPATDEPWRQCQECDTFAYPGYQR